jgi:hypothetical protein
VAHSRIEHLADQARRLAADHEAAPAAALFMAAECCDEALVRLVREPFTGQTDDA